MREISRAGTGWSRVGWLAVRRAKIFGLAEKFWLVGFERKILNVLVYLYNKYK